MSDQYPAMTKDSFILNQVLVLIEFPLPLDEISEGFYDPSHNKFSQDSYDDLIDILLFNLSNDPGLDAPKFLARIDALFVSVDVQVINFKLSSEEVRAFYDSILQFIGSSTITGEEYPFIYAESVGYDLVNFQDLSRILNNRAGVDVMQLRLEAYFYSHGENYKTDVIPKSNILVGAAL